MLRFSDFRDGVGGVLVRRCLKVDVRNCRDWCEFADALHTDDEALVKAARRFDGIASTGERVVLHAALSAGGFGWLADELGADGSWERLAYLTGDHRMAVVACIARVD